MADLPLRQSLQQPDLIPTENADLIKFHQIFIDIPHIQTHVVPPTFPAIFPQIPHHLAFAQRTMNTSSHPMCKTFYVEQVIAICTEIYALLEADWTSWGFVYGVGLLAGGPLSAVEGEEAANQRHIFVGIVVGI